MSKLLPIAVLLAAHVSAHAAITVEHLWSFSGDINDSVGSLNLTNGSAVTMNSETTAGRVTDGYASFPGTAQYQGLWQAAPTTTTILNDNYGVEFWIRLPDYATTTKYSLFLANKGNSALSIAYNDGGAGFAVSANNVDYIITNLGKLTDANWHSFAVVRDNGIMRAFLDGIELDYSANTYARILATNTDAFNVHLGCNGSGNNPLMGDMDEIRYFSFAPGAFETTDLYQVPETSTYALACGLLSLGGVWMVRRRRCLK
ncbi:MAG: LamG domain-containing protein [Puniceicoccales bacterium]|jgi:hypothetical protein|nr:LamG domain-containing protein [Puniceicoccales bacterium]